MGGLHLLRRTAWRRPARLRVHGRKNPAARKKHQPDRRTLAALAGHRGGDHPARKPVDPAQHRIPKEQVKMSAETLTVAVIGAGGKMGMRVSRNLQKSGHTVFYSENSPAGQERITAEGREVTATDDAVKGADVVILAVPDTVLGIVSEGVVPQMKAGSILLTLDPAAAYAGLLAKRDDVVQAVAHPCHPSVFLERTT